MDSRFKYLDFFNAGAIYSDKRIEPYISTTDRKKINIVDSIFSFESLRANKAIYVFSSRRSSNLEACDEYIVVPGFKNPRWIIKNDKDVINNHGKIIKPTSFQSTAIWWLAKLVGRLNFISVIFPDKIVSLSRSLERSMSIDNSNSIGIVYTGSAGCYQKFTLQILNEKKQIVSYLKVGNQSQSRDKVKREFEALQLLKKTEFTKVCIPKIIRFNLENSCAALETQNIVSNGDRKVDNLLHEDYLALLEIYNAGIETCTTVSQYISSENSYKDTVLGLLSEGFKVRIGDSHGDYTPWNRFVSDNKVKVIDWEEFSQRVMFYDLVYFICVRGILINRSSAKKIKNRCEKAIIKFSLMMGRYIEINLVKSYLLLCLTELHDNSLDDAFISKLKLVIDKVILDIERG